MDKRMLSSLFCVDEPDYIALSRSSMFHIKNHGIRFNWAVF
jgi:hypothetical protein